jgi:hypothetical protein
MAHPSGDSVVELIYRKPSIDIKIDLDNDGCNYSLGHQKSAED